MNPRNPWNHAASEGRSYLTPEDVGASIRDGVSRMGLYSPVLRAIADGQAEDPKLCAFVALRGEVWKERPVDEGWLQIESFGEGVSIRIKSMVGTLERDEAFELLDKLRHACAELLKNDPCTTSAEGK